MRRDAVAQIVVVSATKRQNSGEHLIEDHAQRPDVRAEVHVSRAPELFGRHVRRRAQEHVALRERGGCLVGAGVHHLGDAEVEHLDVHGAVGARDTEEVGWLQIAMHDSESVGFVDALAGLQDDLDGLRDGEGSALLHPSEQILALEVFHHHVGNARLQRAHVEDAGHVRAFDLRHQLSFPDEATEALAVLPGLVPQELERDALLEVDVLGGDDQAHAPDTDDRFDPVLVQQ